MELSTNDFSLGLLFLFNSSKGSGLDFNITFSCPVSLASFSLEKLFILSLTFMTLVNLTDQLLGRMPVNLHSSDVLS